MSVQRNFAHRDYLLKFKKVPTISETQNNLGINLGNTILSTMTPIAQKLMNNVPLPLRDAQRMLSDDNYSQDELIMADEKKKYDAGALKNSIHENIVCIGQEIEMKKHIENEECIRAAIKDNEEFEQFESANRVAYHLSMQKLAHEQEKNEERQKLLAKYQNDCLKLQEQHRISIIQLETHLLTKFERDFDKKLNQVMVNFELKLIENQVQFEARESERLQQIKEIQLEAEKMLLEEKQNNTVIIEKLSKQFEMDLCQQKFELITENIAEQMHLMYNEKSQAHKIAIKVQEEYQEHFNEIETKNRELLSWRPTLKPCPNVAVWQEKCKTILSEYEQYVETTKLNETPNQGKYLLPVEKLMENNLSVKQHETPFFKCSYAGGYIHNQIPNDKQPNEKPVETKNILSENVSPSGSHLFLPKDVDINDQQAISDTPFAITTCDCAPDLVQPDEIETNRSGSSTTSLSSFEYKCRHYASIKHYENCQQKHFPKKRTEMKWHQTKNKVSVAVSEENILDESPLLRPIKVSNRTFTLRDITELIEDTEFTDELTDVNASNFHDVTAIKIVICKFISKLYRTHVPFGAKIHVADHNKLSAIHPSSILATIDSIELPLIGRMSHDTTSYSETDVYWPTTKMPRAEKVKRRKKHVSILEHLTIDDYIDTFRKKPPYLVSQTRPVETNQDYKEVRPSSASARRVRVCNVSEDIAISRPKKPNMTKKPSSILRINDYVPLSSEEYVPSQEIDIYETRPVILAAIDSIELVLKKNIENSD